MGSWYGWVELVIVIAVIRAIVRARRAAKAVRGPATPGSSVAGRDAGPRSDAAAGLALGHELARHHHHGGSAAASAFWAGAVNMDDDVDDDIDDDLE